MRVSANEKIIVLDYENGYWKVNYSNNIGYLPESMVEITSDMITIKEAAVLNNTKESVSIDSSFIISSSQTLQSAGASPFYIITKYASDLRIGPGPQYQSFTSLPVNAQVFVKGFSNDYWLVEYQKKEGFIYHYYVTDNEESTKVKEYIKSKDTRQLTSSSYPNYIEKTNDNKHGETVRGITNSDVNLQSGPGPNYSFVRFIPRGSEVEISAENGNYYEVNYKGKVGYLKEVDIDILHNTSQLYSQNNKSKVDRKVENTGSGTPEKRSNQYYVNTRTYNSKTSSGCNLISGPGNEYPILRFIPKNSVVQVASYEIGTKKESNYWKVVYNGTTGYLMEKCVKSSRDLRKLKRNAVR